MTILTMDDFKIWKFPNGEWGVKVDSTLHPHNHDRINLIFKWPDPLNPDFMLPILMGRAIKQCYGREVILECPYMPYLRQDRSFEPGIPIASKIIVEILESTFDYICTLEGHSRPTDKVIISAFKPYNEFIKFKDYRTVSPDENAPSFLSNTLKFKKLRIDGGIKLECIDPPRPRDKIQHTAIIQDDICDGGATFIECAKQLREIGFKEVVLCVAHGIFSKGVDHLFSNGIDKIITTDSVCRLEPTEKLIILDAFKEMGA